MRILIIGGTRFVGRHLVAAAIARGHQVTVLHRGVECSGATGAEHLHADRDADTILVMEAGDIVEHGNHEQLMDAGGAYARLYQSQFAGAIAE